MGRRTRDEKARDRILTKFRRPGIQYRKIDEETFVFWGRDGSGDEGHVLAMEGGAGRKGIRIDGRETDIARYLRSLEREQKPPENGGWERKRAAMKGRERK